MNPVWIKLNDWWKSGFRSTWIEQGPLKAYVRKGPLYFGGCYWNAFTLANVSVSLTGQTEKTGFLAPVLQWMESECPAPLLMVENVISPRLEDVLKRHGWCFVFCYGAPIAYKLRAQRGAPRDRP